LENRESKDDKVFGEIWKIVETKVRETQIVKVKGEGIERKRKKRKKKPKKKRTIEIKNVAKE